MRISTLAAAACLLCVTALHSTAQPYRNLSNARFNTVASGPMQALVVDVDAGANEAAVRERVMARVRSARAAREGAVRRQIEALRKSYRVKGEMTAGIPDIVVLREGGRLAVAPVSRTRADNVITFTFPAATETGAWPAARQNDLAAIINLAYNELKRVYGPPSWTGTVKIIDADRLTPIMSDRNALSGGVYNVSTAEMSLAEYQTPQSTVLTLLQMMAIAFRGPAGASYDAWERGMARAVTLRVASDILPGLQATPAQSFSGFTTLGEDFNLADPLWHALDVYDLLNQPPLGNDRFFPVSKTDIALPDNSIGGMLVPRLRMSGSAWLKVLVEDPLFLATFNGLYYAAVASNPGIKNNVPQLKALAAQALATDGVPSVEGLPFVDWYDRQYVLDTAIAPGVKEYALVQQAARPTTAEDDYALVVTLIYYRTIIDTTGNSDEVMLTGTSFPIYWDYTYASRLFLGAQYERVEVGRAPAAEGEGSVIPVFFNTLGGDPTLQGRMRVTMDFPVNFENARVYSAPRSMGPSEAPNNFWGSVVGADTGTMRIVTETGVDVTTDVKQGAFGVALPDTAFARPNRATLTFTNGTTQAQTVRKVNVGYNEYVPVFYAADPVETRTHQFPTGPAMISFPILPLQPKAAQALVDANTGQPLFTDSNLLLAQWRQSLAGDDKYMRYPTLDPIAPGKGYWSNFTSAANVRIVGRTATQDTRVSIPLLFGWNQIGNPYDVNPANPAASSIAIEGLFFQYQADNVPVNLATAITNGWVAAAAIPGGGTAAVWQYNLGTGYAPATTLQPWQGYWIRVLVTEGVTITYPNPGLSQLLTRPVTSGRAAELPKVSGWAVPLRVRSTDGKGGTVYIGQSPQATNGFDARMDALRPPEFTRSAPIVTLPHADWGDQSGEFYSDIRRPGSREPWDIVVQTPDPGRSYTLTWDGLASVPRSVRLLLVDPSNGARQYLQGSSGYTFTPGSSGTRRFQIVAEDRSRGALRIVNLAVRPTRAAGARTVQIGFELTQGATLQADIIGVNGKVVRRLTSGRAAATGANNLVWDTRDDRAIAVPAGIYNVQISARTPEGDSARVIQPVVVVR